MAANSIDLELGRHVVALANQEWGDRALEPHLRGLVSASNQSCVVSGNWYVISVDPRLERVAKEEIASRGLVPYQPLAPNRERHGRGMERTRWRSMFGPYMFVKCQMTAEHYGAVTSARGVRRFLGLQGKPLPIEDGRIDAIKLVEAEFSEEESERADQDAAARIAKLGGKSGIVWHFSPGDRVKIKGGPFAGFCASLKSAVDTHDRLSVLVSYFGRQSLVEISAFDIETL